MKNKAIQELRGIAITAVILFHAKIGLFPNGYIGVDVFFVISGYLIIPRMLHAIHYNGVWNFYKNRFLRLAPALIFMLVITLPLMLIFGSWVSHSQFLIQAGSTLFLLGNIGAFYVSGNYFAPSGFTPLVHTWSLAVEEQIYLILPLILKYKSRFLNHSIAITSLMFYIIEPILPGNLSNFNFYFFVSRIWEFYLGYIYYRQSNSNNNFLKIKTFNIYFLFLLLLFPIALPRVFATLFAFALIFFIISNIVPKESNSNLLTIIGDRAYSLYLFHLPLIYFAKFTPLIYGNNRTVPTILALIFTIIFAEISFTKIEFRFMLNRLSK